MAPPSASAKRRTRWIQGVIIAASAIIIGAATVNLAGRGSRPTGQTQPAVTTSTVLSVTAAPPIQQPAPAEQPNPVLAPATVEPPPTPTAAQPVTVTYENCTAVWAAIGGPIHRGDPGYSSDLDRDDDGTGCEQDPR